MSSLRDVVLIARTFGKDVRVLRFELSRLDAELGRALVRVDAHYRHGVDLAMFVCRLDLAACSGPEPVGQLASRMRQLGGELVDLANLETGHAARLRDKILPRCEVACRELAGLGPAVDALLAALGLSTMGQPISREPPPRLRFRRGSDWDVGRLGRITDECLQVVTSSPLRTGEHTVVEIVAPSVSASLPAIVIDDAELTAPGTYGFTVRLAPEGPRKLSDMNVLTWARGRLAQARPLPSRAEHRVPLHWPARLRDDRGEHAIMVRDVSHAGLFAERFAAAPGTAVRLRVPADLGDAPIELDGLVARVVDAELASQYGVPAGLGLRVRPIARDTDRYHGFVGRIAQRGARHLLIGARRPRLVELSQHFAAVGYLTTACDDVRGLCRAFDQGRAPEVVLVDTSLGDHATIRARLPRRDVTVLAVDGDPIKARRLVDAALLD